MSSRLRNGIIVAVVGLLLVIFGIFVLNGVLSSTNIAQQIPTPEVPITSDVVTIARDLPLGAFIEEGDVTVVQVPVGFIPRNAITNIDNAIGRIIKFQMVSGEMLLQHHLADPTNVNRDLAYILSENHVLMAFPAIDLMSRNGIIQRGDIVDIFVSIDIEIAISESGSFGSVEEDKVRELFTFDAMQRVSITAMVVEIVTTNDDGTTTETTSAGTGPEVGGGAVEDGGSTSAVGEIKAYLLALNPQDALILKHLRDAGGLFDIVIRSPISTQSFGLTPVTAEFIRELYGLEIIR